MSDLNELHASSSTKITGSDSGGEETNFLDVTSDGAAKAQLQVGSQVIGNTGDRLKVDTILSGGIDITNKIRYDDMNASTGGVARETAITNSWTTVYSYTGVGKLIGFQLMLESVPTDWYIQVILDSSVEVFMGSTGIFTTDMFTTNIYDISPGGAFTGNVLGFTLTDHDGIVWVPPVSSGIIPFASKVEIKVKRAVAGTKKFRAGFVTLIKES